MKTARSGPVRAVELVAQVSTVGSVQRAVFLGDIRGSHRSRKARIAVQVASETLRGNMHAELSVFDVESKHGVVDKRAQHVVTLSTPSEWEGVSTELVRASRDGSHVATTDWDAGKTRIVACHVWELRTAIGGAKRGGTSNKPILQTEDGWVVCEFHPTRNRVLLCRAKGEFVRDVGHSLQEVDIDSGSVRHSYRSNGGQLLKGEYSADGKRLLSVELGTDRGDVAIVFCTRKGSQINRIPFITGARDVLVRFHLFLDKTGDRIGIVTGEKFLVWNSNEKASDESPAASEEPWDDDEELVSGWSSSDSESSSDASSSSASRAASTAESSSVASSSSASSDAESSSSMASSSSS